MRYLLCCIFALTAYAFTPVSEAKSESEDQEYYTIVALGDSLTEGYTLPRKDAYPAQLERLLQAEGYNVRVINHGIAGDTTAGGRSRIAHTLAEKPDLVILELGPNDFLRGMMPSATRANLEYMLQILSEKRVKTLLVGFKAAPNIGSAYKARFDDIFPELAATYDAALFHDFLEGVAGKAELNLDDGIHPNKEGYAIIAKNLLPQVKAIIDAK